MPEGRRAGLEAFLATRDNIYIARQRHISTRGGSENWWDKAYDAGSIEEVIVQGKRGGSNSGCSYCGSPYCSYGYAGHSANGGTGSSGNGVNYGGGGDGGGGYYGGGGGTPDPGGNSGGGGSGGGSTTNPTASVFGSDSRVKAVVNVLLQNLPANNGLKRLINYLLNASPDFFKIVIDNNLIDKNSGKSVAGTHGAKHYEGETGILEMTIYLNDNLLGTMTESGVKDVILHELGHAYLAFANGMNVTGLSNEAEHLLLLTNTDFIAALRAVFPGKTDQWYSLYGYTFTLPLNDDGSSMIDNLTEEERYIIATIQTDHLIQTTP